MYIAVLGAAILIELVVPVAGPGHLSMHLRAMWEAGWSDRLLVGTLLIGCLVPAAGLGLCVDIGVTLLVGEVSSAATAVSMSVMAGAVMAEAAVPPPHNADGTAVGTGTTFVLALMAAAPALAASCVVFTAHQVVAFAAAALVTGGSFWCVKNRLFSHPSSSKMPPVAIATELSWRVSPRG
jgi:hypothetical protein